MKGDYITQLHWLHTTPHVEGAALPGEASDDDADSEILALADVIKAHAETLARYASDKKIRPSLAMNGDTLKIAATDKSAIQAKASLLYALKSLQSLVKGPLEMLMDIGVQIFIVLSGIMLIFEQIGA